MSYKFTIDFKSAPILSEFIRIFPDLKTKEMEAALKPQTGYADAATFVPHIKKWEGGYSNHPADRGGPTMAGITMATYETYCKRKGKSKPTINDLKNMSDQEWYEIFKTMYWDRWQADKIKNQSIANFLVGWVWGSGVWGIKIPQEILGVTVDGVVGPKTLDAVNKANQKQLFDKLWNRKKKYFEDLVAKNPSQKVFLKGWLNRLNDYKFVA